MTNHHHHHDRPHATTTSCQLHRELVSCWRRPTLTNQRRAFLSVASFSGTLVEAWDLVFVAVIQNTLDFCRDSREIGLSAELIHIVAIIGILKSRGMSAYIHCSLVPRAPLWGKPGYINDFDICSNSIHIYNTFEDFFRSPCTLS